MMEIASTEIQIKRLGKEDIIIATQLFALFNDVFNENNSMATTAHLETLLCNPIFICFAAIYKNKVIGGLTAYVLPTYLLPGAEIYIYDIAVSPQFQRMGVGKQLISGISDYSLQNKIKTIFVDANKQDKHAIDFYRSTGASEENVIQFTYLSH